MKKLLALVLALVMVLGVLAGCNKAPATTTGAAEDTKAPADTKASAADTTAAPAEDIWYTAKDVTEIPDYEGDPLTIEMWYYAYSPNGGGMDRDAATVEHVVNRELKRITGVEMDAENSFFNNESTADEMVAKMVASNDFPDVAHSSKNFYGQLAQAGYLWDLQTYVKDYAPTLYSLIGPDNPVYGPLWNDMLENDGGIYYIEPSLLSSTAVYLGQNYPEEYPEYYLNESQIQHLGGTGYGEKNREFVYVKQEYLDQLFPGCHSTASWQALLDEKGTLTQEDICDIPINSNADFEKLLYDIKAIIDEDGSSKYVWASRNGTDNWSFYTQHSFVWGHQTAYTSYYSLSQNKLVKSLEQDWWKDILKQANKWYRDGILDPEAYIYTFEQYKEHVANGEYAVVMWDFPPVTCGYPAEQEGDYRKVFLNYDAAKGDEVLYGYLPSVSLYSGLCLFNTGALATEEAVIQYIRYLEFHLTEAGQKLSMFGTPDLGLYVENEDGSISAAGELAAIEGAWNTSNPAAIELMEKYGLCGRSFPFDVGGRTLKYQWNVIDDRPLTLATLTTPAVLFPAEDVKIGKTGCAVYNDSALNVGNDGMDDWWAARTDWEGFMTKVELAQSDEEFEQKYQEMLEHIVEVGWDEEAHEQMNETYMEKYGKYVENYK